MTNRPETERFATLVTSLPGLDLDELRVLLALLWMDEDLPDADEVAEVSRRTGVSAGRVRELEKSGWLKVARDRPYLFPPDK